ncbi:MAG: hypothetical protein R2741_14165 [Methanolobus sp.]
MIPGQKNTDFTYQNLVDELKSGGEIRIKGNAGKNFAYSLGQA